MNNIIPLFKPIPAENPPDMRTYRLLVCLAVEILKLNRLPNSAEASAMIKVLTMIKDGK